MRIIRKWYDKNRQTILDAVKCRALRKIKKFILETKDVVQVMPAIYRYKRSVVLLQRQIRASVHRILETRRRLLKQYEKSEKHILVTLVRERADFVREQKEAIQGPNQGLQPRPATCTMPFSNEVSVLEEGPNFRA